MVQHLEHLSDSISIGKNLMKNVIKIIFILFLVYNYLEAQQEKISSSEDINSTVQQTKPIHTAIPVFAILIIGTALFVFLRYKKSKRPIKELPLDVRLGGVVDLEAVSNRLIANRGKFLMNIPKHLKGYITAIGTIKLDDNLHIYNVYVADRIDSKTYFYTLRIELINGVISVAKLLTHHEIINPRTVREWESWLDGDEETHPKIGGLQIEIDGIIYKRIWEQGIEEIVRTKYIENIIRDNEHSETLNIVSLYGRELEGSDGEMEYAYISNIEDSDLNNFIRIDLGVAVRENELVVL